MSTNLALLLRYPDESNALDVLNEEVIEKDPLRRLVRPWPLSQVFDCFLNRVVSTETLNLFVIYNIDERHRRHTQICIDNCVWSYLRNAVNWRLAFYTKIPPERNFSPQQLIDEAKGKGIASKIARVIELAYNYGLEWRVCRHILDNSRSKFFMLDVVETLATMQIPLDRHLMDANLGRDLNGDEACEAAARIVTSSCNSKP